MIEEYPYHEFWKIAAEMGNEVVIESRCANIRLLEREIRATWQGTRLFKGVDYRDLEESLCLIIVWSR